MPRGRPLRDDDTAMAAVQTAPSHDDEQLLVRAHALVERGWSRTAIAVDGEGREVEPWSSAARSWSALGALERAWAERSTGDVDAFATAYRALAMATGGRVSEWNAARWRTKQHVSRAFTHALEFLPEARNQPTLVEHEQQEPS